MARPTRAWAEAGDDDDSRSRLGCRGALTATGDIGGGATTRRWLDTARFRPIEWEKIKPPPEGMIVRMDKLPPCPVDQVGPLLQCDAPASVLGRLLAVMRSSAALYLVEGGGVVERRRIGCWTAGAGSWRS
jgi:hypothetical protein